MLIILLVYCFFLRVENAPSKGSEYIIYHETAHVGNDVDNAEPPYEDWTYSKAMHFACGIANIFIMLWYFSLFKE